MKNIILLILITLSLYSKNISKEECLGQEDMIFIQNECINYFVEEGDVEGKLNIIVHGAWKDNTNTLARYTPFASTLSMNTDITTIAFAMPGYSKSSTNNLQGLLHDKKITRFGKKEYINFVHNVLATFKHKYKAKQLNVIAHSAGAAIVSTISAKYPMLIKNTFLAGGRYDLSNYKGQDNLIATNNYINNIGDYTNYMIIYGEKDNISKPKVSIDFYNKLKSLNKKAVLLEVKNHKHLDLDMSDDSIEAISSVLEE